MSTIPSLPKTGQAQGPNSLKGYVTGGWIQEAAGPMDAEGAGVPAASIGPFPVPGDPPALAAPPTSNTGAQNTKALIDWVSCTFPAAMPLDDVLRHVEGGVSLEWVPTERGAMGYRQGLARGNVKVFHDGNADMGVHVVITGQGCRQLEAEQGFQSERDWSGWLDRWLALGVKFTRFDVAFDDFDGSKRNARFTMEHVRRAVEEGAVVSRFKFADLTGRRCLVNGEHLRDAVYFGSLMSEMSVCIYDKAKEQLLPAHVHWVRSELRAKKDRAHELVRLFIKEGVGAVAGVLWGYLDFKNIGTDSNRSRWESCSWWADFLGVCGKLRLSIQAVVRTLQRVKDWLLRQVAPSLALVVEAEAGALDSVVALLSSGKERWKASHRSLLVAEGVAI